MKRKKTEYNFDVPVFQESGADKLYNSCYIQDKPTERFSEALKRYMDELGSNQKTLELLTGISDTSIYFCLCNQREISLDHLIAVCIALRLHPMRSQYLFNLTHHHLCSHYQRDRICLNYLYGCAFIKEYDLSACNQELKSKKLKPLTSLKG